MNDFGIVNYQILISSNALRKSSHKTSDHYIMHHNWYRNVLMHNIVITSV